jgi:hypothetical protein
MNQPKYNSLEDALESVPREAQPTRDLWPAIVQAMGERSDRRTGVPTNLGDVRAARSVRAPRMQWPLALAASLGVVCLVGALCWSVIRQRGASDLTARSAPPAIAGSTLVSFGPPQDADYVAANAAMERTFNERLKLLAPATRARVQADLDTIRRANEDLRSALAKDPASPLLLQLLHSTWQQEIDLYTNVAQSTEPLLMRRT